MTVTQDPSAPLVAVVGATGRQGGSVVQALVESDKAYRIRAFTRDGAKPEARALAALGVNIVVVSLVVENKDAIFDVFRGADYAFLVTNFWEHGDREKETAEGKLLADAAKAGGARGIVWSGLPHVSKITNGKFVNAHHLESKALVTAYGRASGVPFVDIQTGFYNSNFLLPLMGPIKQPDGSYAISWPVKPTTRLPFIDIVRDYGLFVRRAFEMEVFPDGEEVVTYGEVLSLVEVAEQFSQGASANAQSEPMGELNPFTGKRIIYKQILVEELEKRYEGVSPPHLIQGLVDSFSFDSEFGWGKELKTNFGGLARRPRTWAGYVEETDWSTVLA